MGVLTDAEGRFRDAASKKIFFEITLLRAIQMRDEVPIETVLSQLQQLRDPNRVPSAGAVQASAAGPAGRPTPRKPSPAAPTAGRTQDALHEAPPSRSAPAGSEPSGEESPSAVSDGNDTSTGLETLWRELLEAVGRASAFTRSYLTEAHPVSVNGTTLTIGFDPDFSDQLELVNNQRTLALLQTKLKEMGHPGLQVKFVRDETPIGRAKPDFTLPQTPDPAAVATSGDTASTPSPKGSAPAATLASAPGADVASAPGKKAAPGQSTDIDFKNDPLILKALELFKGQIVDVRS
jgi:hypothetical protein